MTQPTTSDAKSQPRHVAVGTLASPRAPEPPSDDAQGPPPRPDPEPAVRVYGADWCGDCHRSRRVLERFGVAYTWLDVAADEDAREEAIALSGRTRIPVITLPGGTCLVEPSALTLRAALGIAGILPPHLKPRGPHRKREDALPWLGIAGIRPHLKAGPTAESGGRPALAGHHSGASDATG